MSARTDAGMAQKSLAAWVDSVTGQHVETLVPIRDPEILEHLRDIVLGAYMRDIDRAMVLDSSGHYERPPHGSEHFDAQQFLIRHYTDTLGEP